jgi:hypothetical protein
VSLKYYQRPVGGDVAMSVQVQVLFDKPQWEIKSLLQARLDRCRAASLVSGFVTVEGIEAVAAPIRANPVKLKHIVVGAGTYRAYEAFDGLIGSGVPLDRFFVHLGHSRPTSSTAKYRFLRYHPMLHSKVYLLYMGDGSACAFVGSHNLTGFALLGLNGEASILIEGQVNSPEISAIQKHVDESVAQSVPYSPGMKEAYSWWSTQFIDGLRAKFDDQPREDEGKRTIVILAVQVVGALPQANDIIYFEIPEALGRIQSFRAEVHIYLFAKRPGTPFEGLARLDEAVASLWCQVLGLEDEQGGVELRADWYFDDRTNPELKRAPKPFRPRPSPRMQQVRVKVWNKVFAKFEYLFESKKTTWEPIFSKDSTVRLPPGEREFLRSFDLVPPEDNDWLLVRGFSTGEPSGSEAYREALRESAPESGAFILFSLRRRKIGDPGKQHSTLTKG